MIKLFCKVLSKSFAPCALSKAGFLLLNLSSIVSLIISAFDFTLGVLGCGGGGG